MVPFFPSGAQAPPGWKWSRRLKRPGFSDSNKPMPKIRLPAKIENLHRLMEFVSAFAESNGFFPKRIQEIELAMEEALVNIFNYAYPEQPGDVEVRCKMEDDTCLLIEIMDNGIPFDSQSLSDPDITASVSERKVGGLGIFLIKKVVDDLQYNQDGDRNILTFIINKN